MFLKVCKVSLFVLCVFCELFLNAYPWQEVFKNKVRQRERPKWMLARIREDLKPYYKGITKKDLTLLMTKHSSLHRYEIRDKTVFLNGTPATAKDGPIAKVLCQLVKLVPMPRIDFVVTLHDSFYHAPPLVNCQAPLFSFAKRKKDYGIILMPDREALEGYFPVIQEMEKGIQAYPWHVKENKAFWRGANSGFLPLGLGFMNCHNFLEYPRARLVHISLNHSELLDAGFNFLPHTSAETNEMLKSNGYVKESASVSEHLKYKYQILVDGYTCAFQRAYWQLFSNSVIFKQRSKDFQWYYRDLQPYIHYIPVAYDFSDLIKKIEWAKEHDEELQQIVKNANQFAETHLRYEDIMLYFYLLLTEYSKLLRY